MVQPEQTAASFANALAGPGDRWAALAVAILSVFVLAWVVPIASEPWPPSPAFIPAFQAAVAVNDLVTAALLFGQFREVRRPSLLLLASGYLFTSLLVVAHMLSFPSLFGVGSLLGGPQTTAWLWFAWHVVPPGVILAYASLAGGRRDPSLEPRGARLAAVAAVLLPAALAGACILAATAGHDHLPALLNGNSYIPGVTWIILAVPLAGSVLALAVLVVRTRLRRALDLWLAVATGAWAIEILLSAVLNTGRFQAGFYVGRLYALLASGTVLVSLLFVAAAMHVRLARALAVERARADDLERSQAELRQAQKMEAVGQLTSGVAHDFSNLLTGIVGALDMLTRDPLSDRGRRMVKLAQQSADRGTALTGQLLTFSRKQHLESGPVDLNALAAGMQELLRSTLGGTVRVEVVPKPGLPHALADRIQVEVVLLNLAINARDAMPQGGAIVIETSLALTGEPARPEEPPAGEWVCLSVSDTGEGMRPDVLLRVFEPFFTTKPVGRGSGLGLPQVLGVAKQLGGGVRIESVHGEGCSVRLYLPKARVEAELPAAGGSPDVDADALRGVSVLVVDDDAGVRSVARAMLEALGCHVVEAPSGAAALDLLGDAAQGAVHLDAALVDYAMPGMNGLEAARRVALVRPGLPILLVTGYADAEAVAVAQPYLAGVIQKPFRSVDLLGRLSPLAGRDRLPATSPTTSNVVQMQRVQPT